MKKTKMTIATTALILMLTISAIITALPVATAQEYEYRKTTHAFIAATPNPVGVNQEVLFHVGIPDFLRLHFHKWKGLTVTVTKPDGTTETVGPVDTDATGGTGVLYVPTMVGTYKLQTHFPEQTYDWEGGAGRVPFEGLVLYEASDSEILELVVQEDPIPYYPGYPLPTEYWTRPIDAQMREWSSIAGNWLESARYRGPLASSPAPETGHILWTKPIATGGLVGAELGPHAFEEGDAYEGKFQGPVVINGVLYYNRFSQDNRGGLVAQGIVAVDLLTGEELWFRNNTRLSFGQIFYWDSFNMHGAFAYLWETDGSTWNAYDPFTGEWVYTMTDVPSGTNLYGPKGEIYRYTIDLDEGWMTLWNSSRTVNPTDYGDSWDGSWGRHIGREIEYDDRVYPAERGIEWNVTIPKLPGSVHAVFFEDRIIGTNARGESAAATEEEIIEMWSISLKPGEEGTLLWQNSWQPPPGDLAFGYAVRQGGQSSVEDGAFILYTKEIMAYFGFDIETGEQIWGPTESEEHMNKYSLRANIHFDKLFSTGYAGTVRAYDIDTGKTLWTYEAEDPYNEILWSNNWATIFGFFTPDHKILFFTMEHSPIDPKPRGGPTILLDAETGEEIWQLNIYGTRWGGHNLIADGIIVAFNAYDNRIYAIGKGPSETTVSIQNDVVTLGSNTMVKGTVMDVSAGTEEHSLRARFPSGVPAVADEHISEWMEYVYMQHERPADASGVTVTLEAVDPNGEYVYLGTATSDSYGNYGFTFEPDVEGQYMIIATFYGSGAYYGSTATTYLAVDPAAAEPIYPDYPEAPAYTTTDLAILAAVIIAIIIGAVSVYITRKQQK